MLVIVVIFCNCAVFRLQSTVAPPSWHSVLTGSLEGRVGSGCRAVFSFYRGESEAQRDVEFSYCAQCTVSGALRGRKGHIPPGRDGKSSHGRQSPFTVDLTSIQYSELD